MRSIIEKISIGKSDRSYGKINAVKVLDGLFTSLSDRERDVIRRRFGLHGRDKETLEEVGKAHNLTRERIRQIESSSINKLRKLDNLDYETQIIKAISNYLLEEHGGIMSKDYLIKSLSFLSMEIGKGKKKEADLHLNYLDFIMSKLLIDNFDFSETDNFEEFFKLKNISLDSFDELLDFLYDAVVDSKNTHRINDLFDILKNSEHYEKNINSFNSTANIDVSHVLDEKVFGGDFDFINKNKLFFSLLLASKKIAHNKFGHWGGYDWREIKPKTINDKIYVVLKNYGKPMHFSEIANSIKLVGFDRKNPNVATVHNELILDGKYILVGRGMYGLKEWGYKEGTVTDVIREVLLGCGSPMSREEIVAKVLDNRMVKKTTVILALMDKDNFKRIGDLYTLVD